jgi:hypothetical protein
MDDLKDRFLIFLSIARPGGISQSLVVTSCRPDAFQEVRPSGLEGYLL